MNKALYEQFARLYNDYTKRANNIINLLNANSRYPSYWNGIDFNDDNVEIKYYTPAMGSNDDDSIYVPIDVFLGNDQDFFKWNTEQKRIAAEKAEDKQKELKKKEESDELAVFERLKKKFGN